MTGNNCLLDTSIIIHSFKNSDIADRLDQFDIVYVPLIAVGELYYGAYRSANIKKHIEQVKSFLQNCTILIPDAAAADMYGRTKAALKAKGKPIPENDIWIAALAIRYELPLFTTDGHFAEVGDLLLI